MVLIAGFIFNYTVMDCLYYRFVSLTLCHDKMYLIQHYVIKLVSVKVSFFCVLFVSSNNKTDYRDINNNDMLAHYQQLVSDVITRFTGGGI